VDAVEPEIRLLLAEFPAVPTAVIMERVGWETREDGVLRVGCAAADVVPAA
jgi:hypothetical protein